MARIALNKTSLHKEVQQLRMYERVLPSLELKRQQLNAEYERAKQLVREWDQRIDEHARRTGKRIPMLAVHDVDVSGLVTVEGLVKGIENLVGVKLPVLDSVRMRRQEYSFLAKPHWVDAVQEALEDGLKLKAERHVARERMEILAYAVRKITQRVNLFKEVLIPTARENIKQIRIALGELERQAVIRSKITKAKQQQQRGALGAVEKMR